MIKKNTVLFFWQSRPRPIPYSFWSPNDIIWSRVRQKWSHFHSSVCFMRNQIDAMVNIGAKWFLRGQFSGCKVHTQPSSEMNKTQVTKWCVRQTTITLSIAPALLLSPLRAEERRENHSVTETGEAKCSTYLSSSISEPAGPQSRSCRERKWSEVILTPDFCTWSVLQVSLYCVYSVGQH